MELCGGLVGTGIGRAVPALFPKQGASPLSEVGPNKNDMRRGAGRAALANACIFLVAALIT